VDTDNLWSLTVLVEAVTAARGDFSCPSQHCVL